MVNANVNRNSWAYYMIRSLGYETPPVVVGMVSYYIVHGLYGVKMHQSLSGPIVILRSLPWGRDY